jgi:RNA polymerase sigma-70 factor (ECF subfamily)
LSNGSARSNFDGFYAASRDRLAGQLFAFLGDDGLARDVVQEAFIRAWTRWGRVSELDDPEAWVRRVAFNLAKNQRRDRRNVTMYPYVALASEDDPASRNPLALGEAMSTLPRQHREALVLHHLVGLSVEETATEMSVPPGTVKSWLHRGRLRLAVALKDGWDVTKDDERGA